MSSISVLLRLEMYETPAKPTFLSLIILRYAKNLIVKQQVEIFTFRLRSRSEWRVLQGVFEV